MRHFYLSLLIALCCGTAAGQICRVTSANANQDFCTLCSSGSNPAIVDGYFSGQLILETDYTISATCLETLIFSPNFDIYFNQPTGNVDYTLTFARDPLLGQGNVTTIGSNKSGRGIILIYGETWNNKSGSVNDFPALEDLMNSNATFVALPVTLTDWRATVLENTVQLYWTTISEADHDYFTIEHSSDGKDFTPLVVIKQPDWRGEGDVRDYGYLHSYPNPGLNFYRLRQTDVDGSETTFDVIMADVPRDDFDGMPHPNPVRAGHSVQLTTRASAAAASLYNMAGAEVATFPRSDDRMLRLTIPGELGSGTYLLRSGTEVFRIMVQ